MTALLANLKTAVESYLGTNICFASLSLDDIDDEHAIDVAQETLQAPHLRQVLATIRAEKQTVLAHRPDNSPGFDEEPCFILAVNYSFNWSTVGLYTTSEAFVYTVEGFVSGRRIDETKQLDALRDTLNHVFANPPTRVDLTKEVCHLIVYGDDAKNNALHHLLAELLNADLVREVRVADSVFSGPSYMAAVTHENMDSVDFEMNVRSPSVNCVPNCIVVIANCSQ